MSADMESIIAASLAEHTLDSVLPLDLDAPKMQWIAECDCDWTQITDEFRPGEIAHAVHQARAVLAAISEAGQVEWAIFRKTADENALPFDWSAGKTYGQSMSRIERMYPRDRDQLQPRSRITGPWERAE